MANRRTDSERRARQCERLARVIRVLQLVLGREQWDAAAIARELECSERTVYRDIQTLTVAGVPVYFDEEPGCYRVRPGFRFAALEPSPPGSPAAERLPDARTPEELAELSLAAARRLLDDAGTLVAVLDRLRTALRDDRPGR